MKYYVSTVKGTPLTQPKGRLEKGGDIELGLECAHRGLPGMEGCWLSLGCKCSLRKDLECWGNMVEGRVNMP